MTTPAVNVNVAISVADNYQYQSVRPTVGPITLVPGTALKKWHKESRPVSGNAERIKGFKKCRPWDHLNEKWFQTGDKASFLTKSGPSATRYDYLNGSIWAASRPPGATVPSSNMINQALNKALQQLKSPDIHLGNFVAEAKKTQAMYVSLCKRIATEVRAFRYTNPGYWLAAQRYEGARDRGLWCLIPRSWLELQYGWKPHMADLYGAMHALSRRGRFQLPYVVCKGSTEDEQIQTQSLGGVKFGLTGTAVFRNVRRVGVQLVYGISNPVLAELSSLGLINPAEIVWEQMRYSFVVDWIVPIGQWLSNLSADVGYQFITGSLSQSAELQFVSSSLDSRNPDNSLGEWLGGGPPRYEGSSFAFRRSCYTSSPVPGLYVKNPLSGEHCLNAAALVTQAFFSRKPR
jgi:hypothetical protein